MLLRFLNINQQIYVNKYSSNIIFLALIFSFISFINFSFAQAVQVPIQDSVRQVVAGNGYACSVTTDNKLYCWGDNSNGESGVAGNNTTVVNPTKILEENHDPRKKPDKQWHKKRTSLLLSFSQKQRRTTKERIGGKRDD